MPRRRGHRSRCRRTRACAAILAAANLNWVLRDNGTLTTPSSDTFMRVFNFSAGPAVLPESVLAQAAAEMLDWHGSGMSRDGDEPSRQGVHRHRRQGRGRPPHAARDPRRLQACCSCRAARSRENAIVPMNLLGGRTVADYVNTGEWSKKSIKEARQVLHGEHRRVVGGHKLHLRPGARHLAARPPDAAYVHICTNETIGGVEYQWTPDTGDVPLVADMSSHILSRVDRRVEVRRHLRRRAEEHRSGGPDARHRAQRPARSRAADHAVGVPLAGAGGEPTRWSTRRRPTRSTSRGSCSSGCSRRAACAAIEQKNIAKATLLYDYLDETRLLHAARCARRTARA